MIIAVDVDNVLNNLQKEVLHQFGSHYDKPNYTLEDCHDYDMVNNFPLKDAMDIKDLYKSPNIYSFVKPLPGAYDGLQKLVNAGHQVYLVTDAQPENYFQKIQWLEHYFPFIERSHIVAMAHKWLFKCDVLIEDNLQNLLTGHHYERICLDYPWNQATHDWVYDIHRCNNWEDIVGVINKLNENEME